MASAQREPTRQAGVPRRVTPAEGVSPSHAEAELLKLSRAQRRLLPQAPPAVPGYRLAMAYRPSYIATGDYCDFFHRPDGDSAVFLGDGSGHGPTACMLVAMMRAILMTHPHIHASPGETLTVANRLYNTLTPTDLFMTGVYVQLCGDGRVGWAAAGQDPPLRVTPAGRVAPVDLRPVGLPLGIEPGEAYETVRWSLGPGERLVFYTDGLVEARDRAGEPFGRKRLQTDLAGLAARPLEELIGELLLRAESHLSGADFEDDFTLVGVERLD
jgi:sigma-B regulation protein RsbU (phosphoserine phosphatase)